MESVVSKNSRQSQGETIYKKKGVALLLNRASLSFRNRLFISTINGKGHSPRVLLREWVENTHSQISREENQGIKTFTIKGRTGIGALREFSAKLKTVLSQMDMDFKKDQKSGVMGTIYITHIVHLWFFLFFKRKRIKLIYDATEDSLPIWNLNVKLLSVIVNALTNMAEIMLLKKNRVDAITISGSRADELSRFKKVCKNVQIVRTLPLLAQSATPDEVSAAHKDFKGKTSVALIGNFPNATSLEEALDVAGSVVECYENVIFLFMGKTCSDKEALKSTIRNKDLEGKVFFLPGLSYKKMMAYLENSRVGLALGGMDDIWSEGSAENSMRHYVYMQAGLPIVGPDFYEGSEVMRRSDCGLFVNVASPVDVSGAVAYLLTHLDEAKSKGEKGREVFKKECNWEQERQKLTDILDAVAVR